MVIAYKPNQPSNQKYIQVDKPQINIPFSYVVSGTGGLVTDTYTLPNNVVITSVIIFLQSNGAGSAGIGLRMNQILIAAQNLVSIAGGEPKALAFQANLPNWTLPTNMILTTTTNCTAGVASATIVWIGYLK